MNRPPGEGRVAGTFVILDDLIGVMGRATIEAVLRMSAETIAGPKRQGKKSDRTLATDEEVRPAIVSLKPPRSRAG